MTNYYGAIPEHMVRAIQDYLNLGAPLGSFLYAVFTNDFVNACCKADDYNVTILPVYARYIYNECPCFSWGSPSIVGEWMSFKQGKSND